jgi:signal peptidase I
MNDDKFNAGRRRGLAVCLSLAIPGLGQIYNGEFIKGTSFFVILQALILIGYRCTVLLPDRMMLFGPVLLMLAAIVLYIIAILDAYKNASTGVTARFGVWYFYLAAWLVGYVIVGSAVFDYGTTNYLQAFKIPTASMEPAVMSGDRILADKTAYRRMAPQKRDVIIFVYPDDRSKMYIKRVEALPGDAITLPDGTKQEVPHGFVYVTGDNRENSIDSRHFGFVPLRDVIGKARQVYFSYGSGGIRWSRIGTPLS